MRRLAYCLLSLALAALLGTSALAGVQPTGQCFTPDTLVHVRPQGASSLDAMRGKSERKAIKDLRPGDEVLAYAEWQEPGSAQTDSGDKLDARLSYQKVSDLIASHREQRVVHVTLDDGQTIEATDGHPFKTTDGWRDAILLRKGGKLLLKGSGEAATITDVRIEVKTLPVFNIEVANAHTFFVGAEGVLVHNGFGSYSCTFNNGMKYHGKGDKKRFDASIKRIEDKFKTKVDMSKSDWRTSMNDATSFRDEAARIANDGGIGKGAPGTNYNMINSPGRRR